MWRKRIFAIRWESESAACRALLETNARTTRGMHLPPSNTVARWMFLRAEKWPSHTSGHTSSALGEHVSHAYVSRPRGSVVTTACTAVFHIRRGRR
ncbi:hypothetical protein K458DRAFT_411689 [Lentithecium fluviatile CBS 122367]|uniref:Uncharacterized protein n=1 Tax=Lentithecium fluviatile CBS 122367 TaxID=1168545 RepID=A0A6G1JNJ3_9PLEO|nr:hypothetical protein K458DRAFT_411689 [Lentithecium fluviatile CBS 122367]